MVARFPFSRRQANVAGLLAGIALLGAVTGFYAIGEPAAVGGPFRLTTQTGAQLSNSDMEGAPFAAFFGFTHCPEVCPTTLWEMSEALKALGSSADQLKVLFISVDPERDTPQELSRYLSAFDPRIVGLTGSEADVAAVAKAYRVYWRKVPTSGGDYTMDHTASVYLMDADGDFAGTISYGDEMSVRMEKLRRLLAEGAT